MKSLTITKDLWNYETNWNIQVKDYELNKLKGSSFKRNAFAEKVSRYLDGTDDCIKHNGRKYSMIGTKFTAFGKKVYLIVDQKTEKPVLIYSFMHYSEYVERWEVSVIARVDENMKFFESYGYTVEDHR